MARHITSLTVIVLAAWGGAVGAQDLGHKLGGMIGLEAGRVPEPAVYLANRLVVFRADHLTDRRGATLPIDLDLGVVSNAVGGAATFELARLSTFYSVAFAVPVAWVSAEVAELEASVDHFGVADIFLQPLRLGWRLGHFDLVTGYSLYVPTGRFRFGDEGGVSTGHLTHQLSLGGTAYFDAARSAWLTALFSYDLNQQKHGLDITRGDFVHVQGGAGARVVRVLDAGLTGYALWQVRDDRGADVPPALRGARDRAFGVGPEVAVTVPQLRGRASLRYQWDFGTESRPEGTILVFGLTFVTGRPDTP